MDLQAYHFLAKSLPQVFKHLADHVIYSLTSEFTDLTEYDDSIHIGFVYAADIKNSVISIMEWWVSFVDTCIDHTPNDTLEYAQLFEWRGITFDEFNFILSSSIEEEEFKHLRSFDYLMIIDVLHRKQILASKEADMETYLKLVSNSKIPIRDFLFKKKVPVYFPISALRKNLYLPGQAGCGKSELLKLLFYDLQRKSSKKNPKNGRFKYSLVLMEPHGDLAKEILGFCLNNKVRERIIYIDPYIHQTAGVKEKYTPVINPFEIQSKDEDSIEVFSQELAEAFAEILQSTDSRSSSLTIQMDALLKPCIATLLRITERVPTIKDLQRFMNDDENDDLVALGLKSPKETDRNFFKTGFFRQNIRQTKSGIYFRIQSLINSRTLDNLLNSKSTINLEKALNSGKILILNLAKSNMGKQASPIFGKLILALIQGIALRRNRIPKEFRIPTFLFIDEFQNFVTASAEDVLAESRKYAISMLLAHQVIGQKMNTEMRNIILGNTTIKIVDKNGHATLDAMSKEIDIGLDKLKKIPKYSFYIHNKDSQRPAYQINSPDFLVGENSRFYMSDKEKRKLLKYFMEESGYYVRINSSNNNSSDTIENETINDNESITPKFSL